jgi:Protein of unknown function (DUF935)
MGFKKGHDPNRNTAGRPSIVENAKKKDSLAAAYPNVIQKFRIHEDMRTWRYGVDSYDNLQLHDRNIIHRIYRQVMIDPHLTSQWNTRINKTIDKQFQVKDANGNEREDLTELIKKPWLFDLIKAILDSYLYGFSLIEFGPVENKTFCSYRNEQGKQQPPINVIDRDYVKPEWGIIVKNWGDIQGLDYTDPQFQNQLLFCGKIHDGGILFNATKYILFKDNCLANWSEFAEVFGMPIRVGKTTAEGDERARFLQTMKTIGANGYGIIDPEDSLEYITQGFTDSWQVYNNLITYCDSQVSKLIFGQDVISNNTGHVIGKVGENISNLYGETDAKYIASVLTNECFTKWTALGLGDFTGCRFVWDTSEKVDLVNQMDIALKATQATGKLLDVEFAEEQFGLEFSEEDLNTAVAPSKTMEKIKNFYSK